jgi:hypothetical protein
MASFFEIFYDPAAVFAKVRERGMWAAPLIATALITILFSFYVSRSIGVENITRRFFDEHPSIANQMPADKKEEAIRRSGSPTRLAFGSVLGGALTALITLISAALVMAALAIMDRKPDFSKVLGAIAWGAFPFGVIGCLMGVLILYFSKDPTELDPQTLLATNLGAILDKNTTGHFLYSLAGALDLLTLGKIGLMSYGTSKVSGIGFGSALAVIVTLWLVWVLLRAGFAAALGF